MRAGLGSPATSTHEVEPSSQSLHQLALVFSLCRDRERTLETAARRDRARLSAGAFAAQEEEFRWLAADPEFVSLTTRRQVRGHFKAPV